METFVDAFVALLAAGPSKMLVITAWIAVIAAIYMAVVYLRRARRIRTRLAEERRAQVETLAPVPTPEMSWLRRWLYVAGYRKPGAMHVFLAIAMVAFLLGLAVALTLRASVAVHQARVFIYDLPGGIGPMLDPLLWFVPWLLFAVITCIPWLVVRAARRRRVQEVTEDLPITLQLLATLSRAGLGLDAAMLRVIESSNAARTLPQELIIFQRENLSGIPRVRCWRRMARRVDVSAFSIFVSAMIHAEQVGGGVSEVLSHQTEDVQSRRQSQAMVKALALPVKLVFPMVICFLPGIFVWTLGPAFYRFLRLIDGVLTGGA